jgi:hypothetical protein
MIRTQYNVLYMYIYIFFCGGAGALIQSSALAKQTLYHLSQSILLCYFGDGGLASYLPRMASNRNHPDLNLPTS